MTKMYALALGTACAVAGLTANDASAANIITTTYSGYVDYGGTAALSPPSGTNFTAVFTANDGDPANLNYFTDDYGEVSGDVTAVLTVDGYAPIIFDLLQGNDSYTVRWENPAYVYGIQSQAYAGTADGGSLRLVLNLLNSSGDDFLGTPDVHADLDHAIGPNDWQGGALYQYGPGASGDSFSSYLVMHTTAVSSHSVELLTLGVPEPASWAMMLGGFGLVGGALRARRKSEVSFG